MQLVFYRESLLYDIGNYAYVAGHRLDMAADGVNSASVAHLITDVCADGNVDRVSRVLALVYAEVADMLSPYLCHPPLHPVLDNDVWEPESYVFELRQPLHLTVARQQLLHHLIHEYMVCRAVSDWLRLSYPSYAVEWDARAAEASSQLHALLTAGYAYRRPLPVI